MSGERTRRAGKTRRASRGPVASSGTLRSWSRQSYGGLPAISTGARRYLRATRRRGTDSETSHARRAVRCREGWGVCAGTPPDCWRRARGDTGDPAPWRITRLGGRRRCADWDRQIDGGSRAVGGLVVASRVLQQRRSPIRDRSLTCAYCLSGRLLLCRGWGRLAAQGLSGGGRVRSAWRAAVVLWAGWR